MQGSPKAGRLADACKIAACAAAICLLSMPAHAQHKVSIGIVSSLTDLTFYIAEQKGYFAEEGITPEFVKFKSGTQMVAPLATGELNVASGSISAALFRSSNRWAAPFDS
jgi:NitT/TauT family transport system substrate-binding protein